MPETYKFMGVQQISQIPQRSQLQSRIGSNKISALLSIVDQGIVSITNVLIALFLARILPKESFGVYIILYSIWLFIYFLQIGLINQSLYLLADEKNYEFKATMFSIQIIFSMATLFVLVLFFLAYVVLVGGLQFRVCVIFSWAAMMLTLKEYARNQNIAELRILRTIVYDTINFILLALLFFIEWLAGAVSIFFVWANIVAACLVVVIIDIIYSKLKFIPDFKVIKEIFMAKYSIFKWNILTNLSIWSFSNLYKYVTAAVLGIKTVAAIGACQYIMLLSNPFVHGIQNFGLSLMSKNIDDKEYFDRLYKKISWLMLLSVTGIAIPMVTIPKQLLSVFYGEKYIEYPLLLQAYGVSLVIITCGIIFNIKTLVRKRTKIVFHVYKYSLPISLSILIPLVMVYDLNGFKGYLILSSIIFLAFSYLGSKNRQE